jgi:hypothetical protein
VKLSEVDSWDEDLAVAVPVEAKLVPLGLFALLFSDVRREDDDWAEDIVGIVVLLGGKSVTTFDEPDMAFVELVLNLGL